MNEIRLELIATIAVITLGWLARGLLLGLLSGIQAVVLKGHNVAGTWAASYDKRGTSHSEHAHLRQVGHRVWGHITNERLHRKYLLRGTVSANIFLATYGLEGRRRADGEARPIDCGAFVLLLKPSGSRMEGRYSWVDEESERPETGSYIWRRPIRIAL